MEDKNSCTRTCFGIRQGLSVAIVVAIIGLVIITVVGLINGNFFPAKVETQIMVTKSPLQVIYRGASTENIIDVVNNIGAIPFKDYKFNSNTSLQLNIEDISTTTRVDKINSNQSLGTIPKLEPKIDTKLMVGNPTINIKEK